MSIFRNISNHSTRGYFALQTLFAASALTLGWSVGSFGDGGALSWALSFCLGVNLTAIMVLIYLQRTISQRLEHASIADEEQARMTHSRAPRRGAISSWNCKTASVGRSPRSRRRSSWSTSITSSS